MSQNNENNEKKTKDNNFTTDSAESTVDSAGNVVDSAGNVVDSAGNVVSTVKTEPLVSYRLSDDLIAVLRELVQLSLLTGTHIVDHMRAVRVNVVNDAVVPTEQYIESYNAYIDDLAKRAEELQLQAQQTEADDDSVN